MDDGQQEYRNRASRDAAAEDDVLEARFTYRAEGTGEEGYRVTSVEVPRRFHDELHSAVQEGDVGYAVSLLYAFYEDVVVEQVEQERGETPADTYLFLGKALDDPDANFPEQTRQLLGGQGLRGVRNAVMHPGEKPDDDLASLARDLYETYSELTGTNAAGEDNLQPIPGMDSTTRLEATAEEAIEEGNEIKFTLTISTLYEDVFDDAATRIQEQTVEQGYRVDTDEWNWKQRVAAASYFLLDPGERDLVADVVHSRDKYAHTLEAYRREDELSREEMEDALQLYRTLQSGESPLINDRDRSIRREGHDDFTEARELFRTYAGRIDGVEAPGRLEDLDEDEVYRAANTVLDAALDVVGPGDARDVDAIIDEESNNHLEQRFRVKRRLLVQAVQTYGGLDMDAEAVFGRFDFIEDGGEYDLETFDALAEIADAAGRRLLDEESVVSNLSEEGS